MTSHSTRPVRVKHPIHVYVLLIILRSTHTMTSYQQRAPSRHLVCNILCCSGSRSIHHVASLGSYKLICSHKVSLAPCKDHSGCFFYDECPMWSKMLQCGLKSSSWYRSKRRFVQVKEVSAMFINGSAHPTIKRCPVLCGGTGRTS
jgi:hypothetical protein